MAREREGLPRDKTGYRVCYILGVQRGRDFRGRGQDIGICNILRSDEREREGLQREGTGYRVFYILGVQRGRDLEGVERISASVT